MGGIESNLVFLKDFLKFNPTIYPCGSQRWKLAAYLLCRKKTTAADKFRALQ